MPIELQLINQKFGRLTVIAKAESRGEGTNSKTYWLCQCECGREVEVMTGSLRSENTQSCGCYKTDKTIERNTTHGLSHHPEYRIWAHIKYRCTQPSDAAFEYYGARGIMMCIGWRDSFANFLRDIGPRPSRKHTIERIDNNGHYSCGKCEECLANGWPFNCRWATQAEQTTNTRRNRMITFEGKTLWLAEWSRIFNLDHKTITSRIELGWPLEKVFHTPAVKISGKLTAGKAIEIRARVASGESRVSVATAFGIAKETVRDIVLRKIYKHV